MLGIIHKGQVKFCLGFTISVKLKFFEHGFQKKNKKKTQIGTLIQFVQKDLQFLEKKLNTN